MKTHKILFTAPGVAEYVEGETGALGPGCVLTETEYSVVSAGTERACLIGSKNTATQNGDYPIQLGYCALSRVLETADDVKDYKPGDRVLVYHGTHSENCVINVGRDPTMLTKVPDGVDSLDASFVIIASMSLGGLRKLRVEPGESVMVMGQGILGIFATQLARISGAIPVIAADLSPDRRAKALEVGADYAFDPAAPDFVENVKRVTGGTGVRATVEVTGASAAMEQALECAAFQGRIALLGCTRISDCPVDYYTQVHRPGVTIIGAHNFVRPKVESYPYHWTHKDDCRALMELIIGGRLKVRPIISEIVSPADAPEVYARLADGNNFPLGVVFDWKKIKQ